MSTLNIGAHLVVKKIGYTHHGIYIGNYKVIHYAGFSKAFKKDKVLVTDLSAFAGGSKIREYELAHLLKGKQFSSEEIVKRAKSRLNEDDYNLVFNNCEHFANWCTHGDDYSFQTGGTVEYNVRSGNYSQAGGLTVFDIINPFKGLFKK